MSGIIIALKKINLIALVTDTYIKYTLNSPLSPIMQGSNKFTSSHFFQLHMYNHDADPGLFVVQLPLKAAIEFFIH